MYTIFLSLFILWSSPANPVTDTKNSNDISAEQQHIYDLYNSLKPNGKIPDFELFYKGLAGYNNLTEKNLIKNKNYLTLIDFTASSNEKRLWVIDLDSMKVKYHELVAHGKNTGNEYARHFSNTTGSYQSSLGFFVTAEPYYGKHGLSLRLDGVEPGINDKARSRAIVLHGADYVNQNFISKYGRLGRSLGCPAVSTTVNKDLINTIKEGSCLFIYYPDASYFSMSELVPENTPKADYISELNY
ncbi:MAG: murein L,D-transpeptidase catalytic domain family protein [Bacteroidota bacterium]